MRNTDLNDEIFAGQVKQEFLPKILWTIKKMMSKRYMVNYIISGVGCIPGYVAVYAEFVSRSKKKKFLRMIHESYYYCLAWIG